MNGERIHGEVRRPIVDDHHCLSIYHHLYEVSRPEKEDLSCVAREDRRKGTREEADLGTRPFTQCRPCVYASGSMWPKWVHGPHSSSIASSLLFQDVDEYSLTLHSCRCLHPLASFATDFASPVAHCICDIHPAASPHRLPMLAQQPSRSTSFRLSLQQYKALGVLYLHQTNLHRSPI